MSRQLSPNNCTSALDLLIINNLSTNQPQMLAKWLICQPQGRMKNIGLCLQHIYFKILQLVKDLGAFSSSTLN